MGRMHRQLLAVMFTDIAGYSAMVNRDERLAQRLLALQRRLVRRQVFRHEGRVIDSIGDGFLVTFGNARAALECATALQLELKRRNAGVAEPEQFRLRIGIHVGDIEYGAGKVFGDGVNVAARLEPLSPRGGIAASAQAVAQLHGPLRACFVSQGERELKNIAEPHEVFALEEAGLDAAAPHLPAPPALRLALRRYGPALAAGVAALAIGVGWQAWRSGYFEVADDASIAVLPLENLSSDQDSADFVAGLHDSLLTEVSTMPQLRVISRTSVMRYAHNAPPVPEIARALKVSYILEGSVQRTARHVRINVQLIRARADQHIWAKTYDRDAADLFEVQSQIAREIARSTQGRVVMDAAPAGQRPTANVEAYDLYLRAIALEDNDPKLGREPATAQIALLEQATTLDPQFGLAWAALARYNIWSANWAAYLAPAKEPAYLDAADRAAQRAAALAPRRPETLLAQGLVTYWKRGDPARVAKYLEGALAARPGYSLALFWLGSVYDRMGETARSAAALAALKTLDPYNERVYTLIAQQQLNQRQYEQLSQTYAEWRAISETPAFVDLWDSDLAIYRTGDLAHLKAYLAQPAGKGVTAFDLAWRRYEVALYERRFQDAAAVTRAEADAFLKGASGDVNSAAMVGTALAQAGDAKAATPYLEAVKRYLDNALHDSPDSPLVLMQSALNDAALGDEQAALAEGARAVELSAPAPGTRPSPTHYQAVLAYAQSLARFGRKQEALQRLGWLLSEPSDVHAHAVLLDPAWAALGQDPDFKALVGKYLPG